MPFTVAARRAMPSGYPFPGRDSTLSGMQRITKSTKVRSFTLLGDPARWLDLQAGIELAHGHVAAAEMLARRAAELREARQ